MKLAEALAERADLQTRIAQMGSRLQNNARVQEGEAPAEDPRQLLRELSEMTDRLEKLVTAINLTNSTVKAEGESLTALLSRRDARKMEIQILRNFLQAASALADRARQSEIKIVSTVKVSEMQKELDRKCRELRQLELTIQSLNWQSDLAE